MRRSAFATTAVLLSALSLSACGQSPGERALTGGLLGAGAGAGVGAISGGNPLTGALIGGGVGAVAGAVTAPHAGYGGPPPGHYRGRRVGYYR
jgi:osmotically inducible lipoprotein OsmB